jgi:ribonucleoside-diphosphate reductase alpha chain
MDQMSPMDREAMKKIYKFTKDFRSLGSGVLAYHTLMQMKGIPVASMDSMLLNDEIFSKIDRESKEATQWLASVMGEPDGCKGMGIRNATRLMMPPTKSTAEIMAGASEGIGLDVAMAFTKQSAGGEFFRINKVLLKLMKERGIYNDENVMSIAKAKGSVQHVDWLTPEEKKVFLTAFEIPQEWVIKLASQRQKYIDQGQSLNLYFTSNDSEEYISKIHRMAFEDEGILALYYIYSVRGADGLIRDVDSCEMCSG